ncbi:MAG TPA: hypothetical protein VJ022_14220, partial [Anaerolineales bacterium]|nr:hypothetical protein [Anaerolineales bacterium]
WTFLLSLGFLLNLAPYLWTFFLGWLILTFLGIHAENMARQLAGSYAPRVPWVGLFFILAWQLTWSAVSGMETLLHGYLAFVLLTSLLKGTHRYLTLGLLAGLSVWVRPDGLTLLGPIIFTVLLSEDSAAVKGRALLRILIGFGALFFPYLLFNLALSGNPMPNTFYAKQAEYHASWLAKPISERILDYLYPMIASPFIVLLPGVLIWMKRTMQERNWGALAGIIWSFGYVGMYFMRLPAYQHGRYIIPVLPILYFWGLLGLIESIHGLKADRISLLWRSLTGVLCLLFGVIGARQNAYDVFWIESQMVATAKWVGQNVPADALLAVHDIGALGYFVPNPVIDLAGLITPEVIPFIRDEKQLADYLNFRSADYLIVFLNDYPNLPAQRNSLFVGGGEPGPIDFENNMHVYLWR